MACKQMSKGWRRHGARGEQEVRRRLRHNNACKVQARHARVVNKSECVCDPSRFLWLMSV
jgi:hypothetical protein